MDKVTINDSIVFSNDSPFVFIGGPCQIESEDHALFVADFLINTCNKLGIPFVFKASFDKANRSSANSSRGLGLKTGIKVFQRIKKEFNCAIITDIHNEMQCEDIGAIVDIIQIPAFLCRQTDLLHAAAKYGKTVNVKKGQFLAPWDVKNIVEKISTFNNNILLTERGTSFGYNRLVVDITGLEVMKQSTRKPIIIDATHAIQSPSSNGLTSGGNRYHAPNIARAAIASTPIAGVFCEVHNDPDNALSDGPNSLNFEMTKNLLKQLKELDYLTK